MINLTTKQRVQLERVQRNASFLLKDDFITKAGIYPLEFEEVDASLREMIEELMAVRNGVIDQHIADTND